MSVTDRTGSSTSSWTTSACKTRSGIPIWCVRPARGYLSLRACTDRKDVAERRDERANGYLFVLVFPHRWPSAVASSEAARSDTSSSREQPSTRNYSKTRRGEVRFPESCPHVPFAIPVPSAQIVPLTERPLWTHRGRQAAIERESPHILSTRRSGGGGRCTIPPRGSKDATQRTHLFSPMLYKSKHSLFITARVALRIQSTSFMRIRLQVDSSLLFRRPTARPASPASGLSTSLLSFALPKELVSNHGALQNRSTRACQPPHRLCRVCL